MKSIVFVFLLIEWILGDNLFHLYSLNVPCNDGSPAGYYFRPGYGNGSKTWVIRLQGGGWCWDIKSCEDRWNTAPYFMSSKGLPKTMNDSTLIAHWVAHGGITSSNETINPYFYNSNQVYVWYCSSDSFLGNQTANAETGNWIFRGKDIIVSLIHQLIHSRGIGNAKRILLSGDSAGGVAALNNADFVFELLKDHVSGVDYKTLVDAGWFLDTPPYGNTDFSFRKCGQGLWSNWKSIFDETCMKSFPGEEWKCFHAQYAYPFVTTSLFSHEFEYDWANLWFNGINGPPFNQTETVYVQSFRKLMLSLTRNIPYVFEPACFKHEIIDTNLFSSIVVNGVRNVDAIGKWFFGEHLPVNQWIDSCSHFNCNPTC